MSLKLENYFFASRENDLELNKWLLGYSVFISLYIIFWVEYYLFFQWIVIGALVIFNFLAFKFRGFFIRINVLILSLLVSPILNSLLYPLDSNYQRLTILIVALFIISLSYISLLRITKLFIIINILFCLISAGIYIFKGFEFNRSDNPPISNLVTAQDCNKDIFIIILDGFPSKEMIKKYKGPDSKFLSFLEKSGFSKKPTLSKYTDTDQSLPNIFSGSIFQHATQFETKDIPIMKNLIPGNYLKKYALKNNYELSLYSLFVEEDNNQIKRYYGRGGAFPLFINWFIDRFFLFVDPSLRMGNITNKETYELNDRYYSNLKNDLGKTKKQIVVCHFLTFHGAFYGHDFDNIFRENIKYADDIGIKAISAICNAKPKAKIIVLSDHGERNATVTKKDSYQGILYIKN